MTVYDVETTFNVRLANYAHLDERQKRKQEGELIDHWRWAQVERQEEQGFMQGMFGVEPEAKLEWVVQRALLFDNEFIWELEDTDYPDIPYTINFFKSVDRDDPRGWTHSIIRPIESTIEMLENAVNRRQRQISVLASLPIVTKAMAGRVIEVDPALGGHIPLLPDEDIAFPKWPGNPPDVEQQIAYYRSRLQQAGFAEQDLTGGAASGYALSQIGDANKIKLEQPVRALNLLWSNWSKKVLRLTKVYAAGMAVRVYGTIAGQDFVEQVIPDNFDQFLVRARFKPEFPGEKVRKHAMATQVRGIISDWTLMEKYLDIDQPDDENKRIIRQMAERHPAVIEYQIRKELMNRAQQGDEAAVMTLMAMQQGGGGGPGGPAPPSPMQATGLQSATGEATPQAEGNPPPGQGLDELMNQAAGLTPVLTA
jgi:hypothetical protein